MQHIDNAGVPIKCRVLCSSLTLSTPRHCAGVRCASGGVLGLTLGPDLALTERLLARPVGLVAVELVLLVIVLVAILIVALRVLVKYGVGVLVVRNRERHLLDCAKQMLLVAE